MDLAAEQLSSFLYRKIWIMNKILIVEDEEHLAEGLKFNLELEDYEVQIANDGKTALEILSADQFDAIVLDVMLPEVNGFEVSRKLRQQKNYTPILMLTALGKPDDVLEGLEAGPMIIAEAF